MPMKYVYICSQCEATSGEVSTLPGAWFSLNSTENFPQGATTEYFDKWECIVTYAQAKIVETAPNAGA